MKDQEIRDLEKSYGGEFKEGYLLIMEKSVIDIIQKKIGYKFNNQYLLVQAFTRSSFAAENSSYEDNEKLEFVGDKVLDLIVVKKLTNLYGCASKDVVPDLNSVEKGQKEIYRDNLMMERKFEFFLSEGEMTEIKKQLVQTSFLSQAIERLGFEKYLIMGKGDIKNNVQNEPHVKEDLLEAIIGAVAIDSAWNFDVIENVIDTLLNLSFYIQNGVEDGIDYISYIQSWHQKEYGKEPNYVFGDTNDGENFSCELLLKGFDVWFEGYGHSKKEAIKLSAKRAYEFLQENYKKCNSILEAVGEYDMESAIGKLQILKDKKLISGLEYLFREEMTLEKSNGNPMWFCQCKVDNVYSFIEFGDIKKIEAKKAAAYEMLRFLTTGRRLISEFDLNKILKGGGDDE